MYAFIHIPKTGGSTIATVLRQSFCTQHCDIRCGFGIKERPQLTAEMLRRVQHIYWRLKSIQGHAVLSHSDLEEVWPDVRYYTFLRDPVERTASEFQYRTLRGGLRQPFESWIREPIARNRMCHMLGGTADANTAIHQIERKIGFLGRMDRFDESLVMWRRWLGDADLDIRYQAKNVMSDNSIKGELLSNSKTRAQLITANEEDVKLYAHLVSVIYPQQVRNYGSSLANDLEMFQTKNVRPSPYPRQLGSLFLREAIYKPLAHRLTDSKRSKAA